MAYDWDALDLNLPYLGSALMANLKRGCRIIQVQAR